MEHLHKHSGPGCGAKTVAYLGCSSWGFWQHKQSARWGLNKATAGYGITYRASGNSNVSGISYRVSGNSNVRECAWSRPATQVLEKEAVDCMPAVHVV